VKSPALLAFIYANSQIGIKEEDIRVVSIGSSELKVDYIES
jgi:hypothetical protein